MQEFTRIDTQVLVQAHSFSHVQKYTVSDSAMQFMSFRLVDKGTLAECFERVNAF